MLKDLWRDTWYQPTTTTSIRSCKPFALQCHVFIHHFPVVKSWIFICLPPCLGDAAAGLFKDFDFGFGGGLYKVSISEEDPCTLAPTHRAGTSNRLSEADFNRGDLGRDLVPVAFVVVVFILQPGTATWATNRRERKTENQCQNQKCVLSIWQVSYWLTSSHILLLATSYYLPVNVDKQLAKRHAMKDPTTGTLMVFPEILLSSMSLVLAGCNDDWNGRKFKNTVNWDGTTP